MKNFFTLLLKIVFPSKCLDCFNYTTNNSLLCQDCFKKITTCDFFICPVCYKKYSFLLKNKCYHKDFFINSCLFATDYKNNIIKNLITHLKYKKHLKTLNTIKLIFEKTLVINKNFLQKNYDLIIPVPLNFFKQRQRGFNQSEKIAKIIGEILSLKICSNCLIRYKNNPAQAKSKNYQQRHDNVKNIFKINSLCKKIILNKNIILVDDVYTTGATLNECAKILKANGAKNIVAICLAK